MADQPLGNPPVMVKDVAGNSVIDPREPEKMLDLAEASRKSNDAKDAERDRLAQRSASSTRGTSKGRTSAMKGTKRGRSR